MIEIYVMMIRSNNEYRLNFSFVLLLTHYLHAHLNHLDLNLSLIPPTLTDVYIACPLSK